MMKLIRRLTETLVLVLICLLLLIQGWQLAAQSFLGQEFPFLFGYAQIRVLSGSMEPSFYAGDRLVLKQCDSYNRGDIITYEVDGTYVTHRIIDTIAEGFVTKGDANTIEDPDAVKEDQIAGKVVFVIPEVINSIILPLTAVVLIIVLFSCSERQRGVWRDGGEENAG